MLTSKTLSITIALLLTIPVLLTHNQSHAMLSSATRVNSATKINPAKMLTAGMRRMSTACTSQQGQNPKGKRYFIAGIVATGGTLYGISLLNAPTPKASAHWRTPKTTKARDDDEEDDWHTNDEDETENKQKVHISDARSCRKVIQEIMTSNKNPDDFITESGESLLVAASKFDGVESVQKLLEYDAARKAREEIARLEAEKKAREERKAAEEKRAQEELVESHLQDADRLKSFIKTMKDSGMNPNTFVGKYGKTPAMAACEHGDLQSLKTLIECGDTSIGTSELFRAIEHDKVDMVKFLLEYPHLKLRVDQHGNPPSGFYSGYGSFTPSQELYRDYRNQKIQENKQRHKQQEDAKLQEQLDAFCAQQPKQ